ncbi:Kelch repeat-containing protein [Chryseolinea lacunae]|uniref:Galactose oxidase n=1 Tax=Chryseolinea lacunae TaxID=2801331 RepID=A0ABS1KTD2_9BACT|nr:hypothetical protein [Chryseolinea lacunae]MBL0742724.1 hypothetical protein [Chryseolinea lacunae]
MRSILKVGVVVLAVISAGCQSDQAIAPLPAPDKKGEWKRLGDFPGKTGSEYVSFVVNGKAYVGLAQTSDQSKEVWEYDPAADSWTQKKDFPYEGTAEVALTIGKKGYVMVTSSAIYEYDEAADTWTFKSKLSEYTRPEIAAFAANGKGYFGTGASSEFPFQILNDFWMFDPVANTWTRKADFPGDARVMTVAFNIGDKGFMGLGITTTGTTNDLYEYDAAANRWTEKTSLPMMPGSTTFKFANFSAGHVGIHDSQNGARLYKYDLQTNEWYTDTHFASANFYGPTTFTIDTRSFVVCPDRSKEVWVFVP